MGRELWVPEAPCGSQHAPLLYFHEASGETGPRFCSSSSGKRSPNQGNCRSGPEATSCSGAAVVGASMLQPVYEARRLPQRKESATQLLLLPCSAPTHSMYFPPSQLSDLWMFLLRRETALVPALSWLT